MTAPLPLLPGGTTELFVILGDPNAQVQAPWSVEIASRSAPIYPQRPESCYLFAGTEGSLAVPALPL